MMRRISQQRQSIIWWVRLRECSAQQQRHGWVDLDFDL
jgi:hypothetical protein